MTGSALGIAAVALAVGLWLFLALRRSGMAIAVFVSLVGIVASVAIYASLGSPAQDDNPLASRTEPQVLQAREDLRFREMTGVLAERLRDERENLEGWSMLSRAYIHLQEWAFAAQAWQQVLLLKGEEASAGDWAQMAEISTQANNGQVDEYARRALNRALSIDPGHPQALHFAALAHAQDGDMPNAIRIWRALLANAGPDSPWAPVVAQYLREAEAQMARPGSGPTAEQMQDAESMSAEDRSAMINQMVQRLANRLADEPDDAQGWLRLGRAYSVLGRRDDALQALDRADAAAQQKLAAATDEQRADLAAILEQARQIRQQLAQDR